MDKDDDGPLPDDHRVCDSPPQDLQRLTKILQVAFVFGQDDGSTERAARPSKRRKVTKQAAALNSKRVPSGFDLEFVPLLNGSEKPELAAKRYQQFSSSWAAIDARIQVRPLLSPWPAAVRTGHDM